MLLSLIDKLIIRLLPFILHCGMILCRIWIFDEAGLWGFQEALLLKGLKIVFKDHGNAPFVSFDVISLSRTCRMDPV